MAMKDYEISSDPLTEKDDDYDPEMYEDGSAEAMGAYYTYIANSLSRIKTALSATSSSKKIKELMSSDENINIYKMLIDDPHLMKDIREAMSSDIIKPFDEDNLLELYMNKVSDLISQIEYVYPERYMTLMHKILPYSIASYYDQMVSEENDRDFEYAIQDDDVQF